MQTITFSDSWFGKLRAQLHEIPYKANNALIQRLQFRVGPAVAKRVQDIVSELPNRRQVPITDTVYTAQLKVGDIVRIVLKPNTTPQLAALVLSVTQKTQSQADVVSAQIFSQNRVNDPLISQNSVRLPHTLVPQTEHFWGKKHLAPPSNKIGKFEIPSKDIHTITLHRTPAIRGVTNSLKRGYNRFLDIFKAEAKISRVSRGWTEKR